MRALGFYEHGGLEKLEVMEVPAPPAPRAGELSVDVRVASLNRVDLFVLAGWPGLKLEMPHWGGCDAAGVVRAVGTGVTGFDVGDRVLLDGGLSCGSCEYCGAGESSLCNEYRLIGEHTRGSLAEQLVAPAKNWHRFPSHLSFEEAAAFPLTFATAWRALVTRGRLRAGENLLVVGSGGGVNTAAIQIGALSGAHVTVLAGGEEKARHARVLGAEHVIDYTQDEKWDRRVHEITRGRGADLVFDNVGKATWSRSMKAARNGGRIVTVGGTTGYDPSAGINYIMWKQLEIIGSTMANRREFATVRGLVYDGKLRPIVDHAMSLENGREAYADLEKGERLGKIVIRVS